MGLLNGLIDWTQRTFSPLGYLGLFVLAFIESSFFPVPPDILLIVFSIAEPSKALFFALICTIGSVLGGMFGYSIGYYGGHPLLDKLFSHKRVEKVHNLYNKYESLAVFIGGFTPLPYKLFTIAGGAFYINFKKFVLASLLSRGLRFFIEATIIMLYGEAVLSFFDKYFNIITIGVGVLGIIFFIIYKKYKKIF